MPKIVYYAGVSLDGYIADSDNAIDWLIQFDPSGGVSMGYNEFLMTLDAVIMGSATYEFLLNTDMDWPYTVFESIVLTTRDLPQPKNGTVRFYNGALKPLLDELRARLTKDIWLVGGGKVAAQVLQTDTIDEYWLAIIPVILGAGIPLVELQTSRPNWLTLLDSKSYPNGAVMLHYAASEKATDA